MWQRVQTLYLALATALLVSLFWSVAAEVIGPAGELLPVRYTEKLPYLVLLSVSVAGFAAALFSFSRRMLQLRLTAAALVVALGLQGWIAWDYFTADSALVFRYTAVFPLIAVILAVLALRGIYADELMVRSASRLRSAKHKK
ncbi:MAG: DUF4293 family protein [Bacteroidales bacterium]|nr:DUF4293 family protein [Bacteroidales bacterium]